MGARATQQRALRDLAHVEDYRRVSTRTATYQEEEEGAYDRGRLSIGGWLRAYRIEKLRVFVKVDRLVVC